MGRVSTEISLTKGEPFVLRSVMENSIFSNVLHFSSSFRYINLVQIQRPLNYGVQFQLFSFSTSVTWRQVLPMNMPLDERDRLKSFSVSRSGSRMSSGHDFAI